MLCAVDASSCSRAALVHARALARVHGARLEALHVWERPHAFGPDPMEGVGGIDEHALFDDAAVEAERAIRTYLAGSLEGVSALHTAAGDPATEIAAFAASGHFDVIVLGTHGKTGLLRWISGSVAASLLSIAPCPVLVVRE